MIIIRCNSIGTSYQNILQTECGEYYAKYCQSQRTLLWIWIMLWHTTRATMNFGLGLDPIIVDYLWVWLPPLLEATDSPRRDPKCYHGNVNELQRVIRVEIPPYMMPTCKLEKPAGCLWMCWKSLNVTQWVAKSYLPGTNCSCPIGPRKDSLMAKIRPWIQGRVGYVRWTWG